MEPLILDSDTATKLARAVRPVEVCTSGGMVLGYFTPTAPRRLDEGPGISIDELNRRLADPEEFTTAEVLAHLENLK